jgi:FtsH-binding integral membrane protein
MVAFFTSFFTAKSVILSGLLTLGVVIGLTVYAFNTKENFSYLYSFLYVSLFVFMIVGFFSFLFGPFFEMIYCIFGVLMFSLWLIYDTQCIMGKIGDVYGIDDYMIAAIDIYLDILNIFVLILRLLGDRR